MALRESVGVGEDARNLLVLLLRSFSSAQSELLYVALISKR